MDVKIIIDLKFLFSSKKKWKTEIVFYSFSEKELCYEPIIKVMNDNT